MQIHKNEITTGLLVLGTMAIFGVVIAYTTLPGVLTPMNTYRIYFDNLNGLTIGAPVLLGGRQIGKVSALQSPVPLTKRPVGHADYEVSVDVQVDRSARVYQNVTPRLLQQGLMGQEVIDFVHGDETKELSLDKAEFVGVRTPDISEALAANMDRLTGENSDLAHTIKHIQKITADDSDLSVGIKNLKTITSDDSDLSQAIKNMKDLIGKLNDTKVTQIISNAEQLSETLKREPWRLLWPSSKSYHGDVDPDAPATPVHQERDDAKPLAIKPIPLKPSVQETKKPSPSYPRQP